MRYPIRLYAGALAVAVGGIGVGAAVASAAGKGPPPAAEPAGLYVFACVNPKGQIDYLEFRKPLPHQCSRSGESLWHWAISPVTTPSAAPSPSASPTPSPSPSDTATPTPSPTPTATPSPTDAAADPTSPAPQGSWGLGGQPPSSGD